MRMHIDLDPQLVRRIDAAAGPRRRTEFIRQAVEAALSRQERAALIASGRGALSSARHDWDDDPADWVRSQRRTSRRRLG